MIGSKRSHQLNSAAASQRQQLPSSPLNAATQMCVFFGYGHFETGQAGINTGSRLMIILAKQLPDYRLYSVSTPPFQVEIILVGL